MKKDRKTVIYLSLLLLIFLAGCVAQKTSIDLVANEKKESLQEVSKSAVGCSSKSDFKEAIAEAVNKAKGKLGTNQPNFAYVVYVSEDNHEEIIDEVRNQIGPGVKIFGLTSNMIITNDCIIEAEDFAVGVLLVASEDINIGIGTIDLETALTPEDAGKTAITEAIKDAGKDASIKPKMILYMGTTKRGEENQIMDGIADIVGKDVPVVGGNSKDFSAKFHNNWRQFTHEENFNNGLIVAAIYTENKVGWGFESTFKITDKKGVVTKSDGFRIVEIDNRPALDVYDEWVDGEFYEKLNAGEFNSDEEEVDFTLVKGFTLLNPIAKIVRGDAGQIGHFATSPIPDAKDIEDKSISVYAQVVTGDEISLYRGTWEIAMNRVETIPRDALLRSGLKKGEGTFAVMAFCNGLKTILPKEELAKVSIITDDILGVPFIGAITAGEQGPIPGIRNVNANLIESVVLVG
ncbi:FIST C-terminal domain-containing protein [Candidatus Woesearchaeota archaeon]|nr:FIST C-terminal domain-containing protein [Candidatus Woesearchaeota archaeon]